MQTHLEDSILEAVADFALIRKKLYGSGRLEVLLDILPHHFTRPSFDNFLVLPKNRPGGVGKGKRKGEGHLLTVRPISKRLRV